MLHTCAVTLLSAAHAVAVHLPAVEQQQRLPTLLPPLERRLDTTASNLEVHVAFRKFSYCGEAKTSHGTTAARDYRQNALRIEAFRPAAKPTGAGRAASGAAVQHLPLGSYGLLGTQQHQLPCSSWHAW
eukprot:TRINITY_DN1313_c0_g1_i1.p2 TRINITY_DN1313_c0_g1~~TRINITY_DN1313_c0_g1_i1.p2  ORF type:complete len:129 (+),score=12.04 TRINITY_DN1313_c0_g1_i1:1307-1693(+)